MPCDQIRTQPEHARCQCGHGVEKHRLGQDDKRGRCTALVSVLGLMAQRCSCRSPR